MCGTGRSGFALDPYGNIYPCVQWRRPLGNLHEKSVKEIWTTSPVLGEIRRLTVEAKQVVNGYGPRGPLLGFCPGLALMNTGSPIRIPASAIKRMEIRTAVRTGGSEQTDPRA